MKKKKKMLTLYLIILLLLVIPPNFIVTSESQEWVSSYGRLKVYPTVSREIIKQKQFFEAQSFLPNQSLDIAFRFDYRLSYGGLYYLNDVFDYVKVDVEHIFYNGYHWYILNGIYFTFNETKYGYWEYDTPIGSSGKWDLFLKRSSDSLSYALDNDLFVHLDPWWNGTGWSKRNCTDICNGITDYQVLLNISYDADMNADFSDVRFVADNTTELYHWYETIVNGEYAHVWVNISDADYMCMYYGNDLVSYSSYLSGSDTWDFFDDFDSDLSQWNDNSGGDMTLSSGNLVLEEDDATWSYIYVSLGDAYNWKMLNRIQAFNGYSGRIHSANLCADALVGFDATPSPSVSAYLYDAAAGDGVRVKSEENSGAGTQTGYIESDGWDYGVWTKQRCYYYDETYIYDDDQVLLSSETAIDDGDYDDAIYLYIQMRPSYGSITYMDYICVGKYTMSTEPSFCDWEGEEEQPVGCDCNLTNPVPVNGTIYVPCYNGYTNLTVGYNITCGNFTGAYINVSMLNMSHNVSISANGTAYLNYTFNLSCETNYTWYVNLTGPNCDNRSWYWFISCNCSQNDSNISCCDCFNQSCFMYLLNLSIKNYLEEGDYGMEVESFVFGPMMIVFIMWVLFTCVIFFGKNKYLWVMSSLFMLTTMGLANGFMTTAIAAYFYVATVFVALMGFVRFLNAFMGEREPKY